MDKRNLPIGIRANNPGNIRVNPNNNWKGRRKVPVEDGRFEEFETPVDGIRALGVLLTTYFDRYGLDTIEKIIDRWAPASGFNPQSGTAYTQNTRAYVTHVSETTGFSKTERLNLHNYNHMRPLVEAIIRHENGSHGPLSTKNTWYNDEIIDAAMARMGLPKPAPKAVTVPVTGETLAATGTAGIGASEIAVAGSAVADAMRSSEDHISSGSIIRIVFGVALVILAGVIAYNQIKRNRQGVIE